VNDHIKKREMDLITNLHLLNFIKKKLIDLQSMEYEEVELLILVDTPAIIVNFNHHYDCFHNGLAMKNHLLLTQ